MQQPNTERNALLRLSLELAKELVKLCPDPIHKTQVQELEAEIKKSESEPRAPNRRFQTWAGTASTGVLEKLLGIPETEEPTTVWPIVDHETCGPINGFPRTDQWCAVTFSSEMQNTVARALEKYYGDGDPDLDKIGEKLRTQDNQATAAPMFCVQGRRRIYGRDPFLRWFRRQYAAQKRIYGMDPKWSDNPVWIDTEDGAREVPAPENPDNPPGSYELTGYVDVWETLAVCFTEAGCQEHLGLNGHNYRHYEEVRIYAESFHRNPEMLAIRDCLMGQKPNPLGSKEDYEADVAEAKATCKANPSTKNQEDVLAAESALKRHYPKN